MIVDPESNLKRKQTESQTRTPCLEETQHSSRDCNLNLDPSTIQRCQAEDGPAPPLPGDGTLRWPPFAFAFSSPHCPETFNELQGQILALSAVGEVLVRVAMLTKRFVDKLSTKARLQLERSMSGQ